MLKTDKFALRILLAVLFLAIAFPLLYALTVATTALMDGSPWAGQVAALVFVIPGGLMLWAIPRIVRLIEARITREKAKRDE